jgi:hypothetical protein
MGMYDPIWPELAREFITPNSAWTRYGILEEDCSMVSY